MPLSQSIRRWLARGCRTIARWCQSPWRCAMYRCVFCGADLRDVWLLDPHFLGTRAYTYRMQDGDWSVTQGWQQCTSCQQWFFIEG